MRLIDADALLEEAWDVDCRCGYVQVVDVGSIEEAPTIEAKPVVHAHWDIGGVDGFGIVGNWKCSACKRRSLEHSNYCPNCGAQMDEPFS